MSFQTPQFPTAVDFWLPGNPVTNPPDVQDFCQMYQYSRNPLGSLTFGINFAFIRLPKSWWVNIAMPTVNGMFQIADYAGNKWQYIALSWDYIHLGFSNVYVEYLVQQVKFGSNTNVPDNAR